MAAMKFMVLVFALFVAFDFSQGTALDKSEKCEQLSTFAYRALAKFREISPAREQAALKQLLYQYVGVDINNKTVLDITLCNIADATTVRELYEAVPRSPFFYEWFKVYYQSIQTSIASMLGGYTNAERVARMLFDMKKWSEQLKPGRTLKEKTDLATLTNFLNSMQVKYGSRWLSVLLNVDNQNFLIEDPVALAKTLYENNSYGTVAEVTGLTRRQASSLLSFIKGHTLASPGLTDKYFPLIPMAVEAVNLAGDLGLLSLST